MDFLDIAGKTFLIFGVANKKSVAFFISQILTEAGAEVVYVVQSDAHKESFSLPRIYTHAMLKGKRRSQN